jgi:ankyrin repeat protein
MLLEAIVFGKNDKIRRLIRAGADVNAKDEEGRTALTVAITTRMFNKKEKMGVTLPFSTKDWISKGPVTWTTVSDNIKTVRILIDAGADVNTRDNFDNTPLIYTTNPDMINGREIAAMLIQNGADMDAKGNGGQTALMHAGENGYAEMAKTLIGNGAKASTKDSQGKTALMLARKNGHEKTAEIIRLYPLEKSIGKEKLGEFVSNFDECIS